MDIQLAIPVLASRFGHFGVVSRCRQTPFDGLAHVLLFSSGQNGQHHAAGHAQHNAVRLGSLCLQDDGVAVELAWIENHLLDSHAIGFAPALHAATHPVAKTGNAGGDTGDVFQLEGVSDVHGSADGGLARTLVERCIVFAIEAGTGHAHTSHHSHAFLFVQFVVGTAFHEGGGTNHAHHLGVFHQFGSRLCCHFRVPSVVLNGVVHRAAIDATVGVHAFEISLGRTGGGREIFGAGFAHDGTNLNRFASGFFAVAHAATVLRLRTDAEACSSYQAQCKNEFVFHVNESPVCFLSPKTGHDTRIWASYPRESLVCRFTHAALHHSILQSCVRLASHQTNRCQQLVKRAGSSHGVGHWWQLAHCVCRRRG